MKVRPIIIWWPLFACVVAIPPLLAKEPKPKQEISGKDVEKALIEAPTPPYPAAFRARRLTGTGSYWLRFNTKTGCVDAVKIVQSSGHAELDNIAVATFYRWRCRPGWLESATIPATFTLDHPHHSVGVHSY